MHCELLWIKVSDTYTAVKLGQCCCPLELLSWRKSTLRGPSAEKDPLNPSISWTLTRMYRDDDDDERRWKKRIKWEVR